MNDSIYQVACDSLRSRRVIVAAWELEYSGLMNILENPSQQKLFAAVFSTLLKNLTWVRGRDSERSPRIYEQFGIEWLFDVCFEFLDENGKCASHAIENGVSIEFGKEDDGRVFADIRLFVNAFETSGHYYSIGFFATPIHYDVGPCIKANRRLVNEAFSIAKSLGWSVSAVMSEQIVGINDDGFELEANVTM